MTRISDVLGVENPRLQRFVPVPYSADDSAEYLAQSTPAGFVALHGVSQYNEDLGPGGVIDMGAYVSERPAWVALKTTYREELRFGDQWQPLEGRPRVPMETLRRLTHWKYELDFPSSTHSRASRPASITSLSSTGSCSMFLPDELLVQQREYDDRVQQARVSEWLDLQ